MYVHVCAMCACECARARACVLPQQGNAIVLGWLSTVVAPERIRKFSKIGNGRHKPRPTALEGLGALERDSVVSAFEIVKELAVCLGGNWDKSVLGEVSVLIFVDEEKSVVHAQGPKNTLLKKVFEGFARPHLDQGTEQVRLQAIHPSLCVRARARARLYMLCVLLCVLLCVCYVFAVCLLCVSCVFAVHLLCFCCVFAVCLLCVCCVCCVLYFVCACHSSLPPRGHEAVEHPPSALPTLGCPPPSR